MFPGDLHYDVVHGICTLRPIAANSERSTSVGNRGSFHGSSDDGTCDDELHAIEANVAHLTDEPIVGDSRENVGDSRETVIERLCMLRSKLDLDQNRRITDHSDVDDGCWIQKSKAG